jgi:hypothetical protein
VIKHAFSLLQSTSLVDESQPKQEYGLAARCPFFRIWRIVTRSQEKIPVRLSVSFAIPLACALTASTVRAEDTTQVGLSGKQLTYIGLLDEDANRKLFDLYDSVKDKPTELSIRSTGGEVNTGMALGRWVHAHHLDVKVLDYCLSSCANYVFPAGAQKTVSNFAMIGFHGGAGSEHVALSAEAQQQFSRMSPQERAAFVADLKAIGKRNTLNEGRYSGRSAYARTWSRSASSRATMTCASAPTTAWAGPTRSRTSSGSGSATSTSSTRPGNRSVLSRMRTS